MYQKPIFPGKRHAVSSLQFLGFKDRLMKTRYQHNLMAVPMADQALRRRVVPCLFAVEWQAFAHVDVDVNPYISQSTTILNNKFAYGYRKRRELVS
jgi:hypothetical protein